MKRSMCALRKVEGSCTSAFRTAFVMILLRRGYCFNIKNQVSSSRRCATRTSTREVLLSRRWSRPPSGTSSERFFTTSLVKGTESKRMKSHDNSDEGQVRGHRQIPPRVGFSREDVGSSSNSVDRSVSRKGSYWSQDSGEGLGARKGRDGIEERGIESPARGGASRGRGQSSRGSYGSTKYNSRSDYQPRGRAGRAHLDGFDAGEAPGLGTSRRVPARREREGRTGRYSRSPTREKDWGGRHYPEDLSTDGRNTDHREEENLDTDSTTSDWMRGALCELSCEQMASLVR